MNVRNRMLVKRFRDCREVVPNDGTRVRELLSSLHDEGFASEYSLAVARVEPRGKSLPHVLDHDETYYLTKGRGRVHVGNESCFVEEGDAVYIPKGETQWIENLSDGVLEFVCVVFPPWKPEIDHPADAPPRRRA